MCVLISITIYSQKKKKKKKLTKYYKRLIKKKKKKKTKDYKGLYSMPQQSTPNPIYSLESGLSFNPKFKRASNSVTLHGS